MIISSEIESQKGQSPAEQLRNGSEDLQKRFQTVLSQIPEFRKAAIEAFFNLNDVIHFTKDGKEYSVYTTVYYYQDEKGHNSSVKSLEVRKITPEGLVRNEVKILVGENHPEISYWASDLQGTHEALDGAEKFLTELETLKASSTPAV